MIERMTKDI